MAITDNILRVNNARGVVSSIIDRGNYPMLINQYYGTSNDWTYKSEIARILSKTYNLKTIKEIPLDVVIRYTPSMSVAVTSNPIQKGVNVNDHVYNNPDTMVVNFGTADNKGTLARMSGLIRTVQSVVDDIKNIDTPSRLLLAMLYKAKEERTLFTIDDGLRTYTDMLIQDITYDKDKSTYRSLVATITLQQMIYVDILGIGVSSGVVRTQAVPLNLSGYADKYNKILSINLV